MLTIFSVYHSSASELIRHFWDAFPPTTPELAEKARNMFETLNKFQQMKVIINYNTFNFEEAKLPLFAYGAEK